MDSEKIKATAQVLEAKQKELEQKLEEMSTLSNELSEEPEKIEDSSETPKKASEPSEKKEQASDENEILKKRFKDTQAAYTRARQEVAALKAEIKVLKEELQKAVAAKLPKEELEKLENLKYENPDEWRLRMNELERMVAEQTLDGVLKKAEEVKKQTLKQMEEEIYKEFKQTHPDFDLHQVYDQLPLGLIKRYEEGKLDYASFLEEAYTFVNSATNIKQPENPPKSVDLGAVGGSTEPSEEAKNLDINELYINADF